MSALAAGIAVPILIDVAKKIGAPFVKSVLEKHVGGAAGEIAETVIDAIAGKAGVDPLQLPSLPLEDLETAVREVERESPELILAHVEQQRLTNELLLSKDKPAWLNGWQWFLMVLWGINGPGIMIANAVTGAGLSGIPWDNLMWLTITYQGLNMGGHWTSGLMRTWRAGK